MTRCRRRQRSYDVVRTLISATIEELWKRKMTAKTHVGTHTLKHRYAEMLDAQEFHRIKKFVAACRRHWPGAMIVLRPDGAPVGASPPSNLNPAPGGITDE
jgi:hypothetical protein